MKKLKFSKSSYINFWTIAEAGRVYSKFTQVRVLMLQVNITQERVNSTGWKNTQVLINCLKVRSNLFFYFYVIRQKIKASVYNKYKSNNSYIKNIYTVFLLFTVLRLERQNLIKKSNRVKVTYYPPLPQKLQFETVKQKKDQRLFFDLNVFILKSLIHFSQGSQSVLYLCFTVFYF